MAKPKLTLYLRELPSCACYGRIFNAEYEGTRADTEEKFLAGINDASSDVAVVRFCSAREEDVENMLRLDALTGPLLIENRSVGNASNKCALRSLHNILCYRYAVMP